MVPATRRVLTSPLVIAAVAVAAIAIAVGGVVLLARLRAEIRLTDTRLPGFALRLPAGFAHNGTYGQGNGRAGDRDGAVIVSWQTGELTSEDDATLLVNGVSTMLPGRATMALGPVSELVVAGQPARTAVVTGSMRGRMTWFACDGRSVIVMSLASDDSAGRLHERVMSGARCTPEPHAAPTTGVTATRTEGWFSVESPEPGGLAMVREDGTALLASTRHVADRPTGPIPVATLESLLTSAGVAATLGPAETAQGADGPRTLWRGTGDDYDVITAVWFCEAPLRLVMGFGVTPIGEAAAAARKEVEAQLATVHCLQPGEAPLVLPPMEDGIFDPAAEAAATE